MAKIPFEPGGLRAVKLTPAELRDEPPNYLKKPYSPPKLTKLEELSSKSYATALGLVVREDVGDFVPGKIFFDADAGTLRRLPLILS